MNLIERSIDPGPTASRVPICERHDTPGKACKADCHVCAPSAAPVGVSPSRRSHSQPFAASELVALFSHRLGVPGDRRAVGGVTLSAALQDGTAGHRCAGVVGCSQHGRWACRRRRLLHAGVRRRVSPARQSQAMNAWRRSTSSQLPAPTGSVTLVAHVTEGKPGQDRRSGRWRERARASTPASSRGRSATRASR